MIRLKIVDKVPDQVTVEEGQQDTDQPEHKGDYCKGLTTEKLYKEGIFSNKSLSG